MDMQAAPPIRKTNHQQPSLAIISPVTPPQRCQVFVQNSADGVCTNNGLTKSGRIKTTRNGCHVCMINLCPGRCFIKFHEVARRQDTTSDTATSETATSETTTPVPQKKQEEKRGRRRSGGRRRSRGRRR